MHAVLQKKRALPSFLEYDLQSLFKILACLIFMCDIYLILHIIKIVVVELFIYIRYVMKKVGFNLFKAPLLCIFCSGARGGQN